MDQRIISRWADAPAEPQRGKRKTDDERRQPMIDERRSITLNLTLIKNFVGWKSSKSDDNRSSLEGRSLWCLIWKVFKKNHETKTSQKRIDVFFFHHFYYKYYIFLIFNFISLRNKIEKSFHPRFLFLLIPSNFNSSHPSNSDIERAAKVRWW